VEEVSRRTAVMRVPNATMHFLFASSISVRSSKRFSIRARVQALRRVLRDPPPPNAVAAGGVADGTTMNVSPRLLLYSCNYKEERSLLSLKHHGSKYDCTPCLAALETFAGRQGLNQQKRDVTETVTAQLDSAQMRYESGKFAAVKKIEDMMGIHCRVPALAGWAAQGSVCKHLYQVTGFDRLNVRFLLSLSAFTPTGHQ